MIISESKKFVFFHIPKTAGQSISRGLSPYKGQLFETFLSKFYSPSKTHDILNVSHINQTIVKTLYPELKDLCKDFFEFSIVRNPYTRVLSMYGQIKKNDLFTGYVNNLDTFIINLEKYQNQIVNPVIFNSQLFWLNDPLTSKIHYYKFEDLKSAWLDICNQLQISCDLPFINKNPNLTDINQLSGKQRVMIYNLYKEEFIRFGYSK